jgi:hypothetical protein
VLSEESQANNVAFESFDSDFLRVNEPKSRDMRLDDVRGMWS